jgi:hypothetical protein
MDKTEKVACYHQAGRAPQQFDVLAFHQDGTVDLGLGGVVTIGHCRVTQTVEHGCCTLGAAPPAAVVAVPDNAPTEDEVAALVAANDALEASLEQANAELGTLRQRVQGLEAELATALAGESKKKK